MKMQKQGLAPSPLSCPDPKVLLPRMLIGFYRERKSGVVERAILAVRLI